MLHGRNNENILHMKELLFPWGKESFVPAMQHGCRAKPLLNNATAGNQFANSLVNKAAFTYLAIEVMSCEKISNYLQSIKNARGKNLKMSVFQLKYLFLLVSSLYSI